MNIDDRKYVKKLILDYSKLTGCPYIVGTKFHINDFSIFVILSGLESSPVDKVNKYIKNMEVLIETRKRLNEIDGLDNSNDKWLEKNLNSIKER